MLLGDMLREFVIIDGAIAIAGEAFMHCKINLFALPCQVSPHNKADRVSHGVSPLLTKV